MKIAVCVKHIPGGQLRINPDSKQLERGGPGELNGVDKNAIEEAVKRKEADGAEVVVVSMGPDQATESLRTALALGADRAVLVNDPAAAGSDLIATSKVLAAALARENADLILFGQGAGDGGGSLLWAAVAERLRLPVISQAAELVVDGSTVRVTRQTEYGDDVIEATVPAVVAVSDSINVPRYTSLKGMMGAKKKPFDSLSVADVGLAAGDAGEAGSKTQVLGIAEPPARLNARKVEDSANAAQVIVDFLAEMEVV
jgi:electron transfer flavoprotein beta subunit